MSLINIAKGSDRFLWMQIEKDPGLFQFSETNLSDVTCKLYDHKNNYIGTYKKSDNTLVPVTLSYDSSNNEESTPDNDSDTCEIKLIGTTTTTKAIGRMKAVFTLVYTNINFPDDTYDLVLPVFETLYNLVTNPSE